MREHIKIDKDGYLCIKRSKDYKIQACPHHEDCPCGDHCPLFREPHKSPNTGTMQISLCHTEIVCETFVDERGIELYPFTIEVNTPCCGNTRFIVKGETDGKYICEGGYTFDKRECRKL